MILMDETAAGGERPSHTLIASDRVEGTPVRRAGGEKIGEVKRLMIDKLTGKVAYAIMKFGGFLGIGGNYYALPWDTLQYNRTLEAYEINLTDEQLRSAPSQQNDTAFDWGDRSEEIRIHSHYNQMPYWGAY